MLVRENPEEAERKRERRRVRKAERLEIEGDRERTREIKGISEGSRERETENTLHNAGKRGKMQRGCSEPWWGWTAAGRVVGAKWSVERGRGRREENQE